MLPFTLGLLCPHFFLFSYHFLCCLLLNAICLVLFALFFYSSAIVLHKDFLLRTFVSLSFLATTLCMCHCYFRVVFSKCHHCSTCCISNTSVRGRQKNATPKSLPEWSLRWRVGNDRNDNDTRGLKKASLTETTKQLIAMFWRIVHLISLEKKQIANKTHNPKYPLKFMKFSGSKQKERERKRENCQ